MAAAVDQLKSSAQLHAYMDIIFLILRRAFIHGMIDGTCIYIEKDSATVISPVSCRTGSPVAPHISAWGWVCDKLA